jgi:hypothetical protein
LIAFSLSISNNIIILIMPSGPIFTRYLYIYDEVKIGLLTSLLNRKESTLFWAFELYYSGFEEELIDFLWKIYYMFYFTLNPGFQEYFSKKLVGGVDPKLIATIVENLMIRPYNCDVFFLLSFGPNSDDALSLTLDNIRPILLSKTRKNIHEIFQSVLEDCKFIEEKYKISYLKKWKKTTKTIINIERMRLITVAYIIHLFSLERGLPMGKNLYLTIEPEKLVGYETILYDTDERTNKRAYNILPLAYVHSIDEDNYLSLFPLERSRVENIKDCYWYHWEYYASFSPIWKKRIEKYGGVLNEERKRVVFEDGSYEEEMFYEQYNYEPDEQKIEVQRKSIQNIVIEMTWTMFYEKHGKKGLNLWNNNSNVLIKNNIDIKNILE